MGSWGTGIFQNDVSEEVRTDYRNKLKLGKSDEEALKELLDDSQEYLKEDDDRYDFWFALSSVMYDLGRLTNEVKNTALELIADGGDLMRWSDNKGNQKKRVLQLENLKLKLLSEQPERKKIKLAQKFICPWNVNDIFVYQLENVNKYILIAVDKFMPYDSDIIGMYDMLPVTFLKLSDVYPETLEDVNNALFLPRWFNQNGLAEFRCMWFKTGFKKASAKFKYVGNFPFGRPKLIQYDRNEGLCYCGSWHRLDTVINDGIKLLNLYH